MKEQIEMVKKFHEVFGAPVEVSPVIPTEDRLELRCKLIYEEAMEFIEAAGRQRTDHYGWEKNDDKQANLVEMADALMDLLYVTYGTLLELGLADIAEDMFAEVQASNMSKAGPDGKAIKREDGKILKGPNFFLPNLKQFIDRAQEQSALAKSDRTAFNADDEDGF